MGKITTTIVKTPDSIDADDLRRLEPINVDPSAPRLHPGELYQVEDSDGTWHAAAVGPGVLCGANRDVAVRTVAWDYGTDHVSCPELACLTALGRG